MDLAKIKELLRLVAESGVAEVEVEEEEFKLIIRKNAPPVIVQPSMYPFPGAGYPMGGYALPSDSSQIPPPTHQAPGPAPASLPPEAEPKEERKAANEVVVKAPIVGTFYRSPAPDEESFVNVDDEVGAGDVLCIIEAMKLMNEIESEVNGVVRRILVENAQAVEYDQPLFVIETA
jgi:acetyl-CoA carboxylase biotin carboxyl carrier protein